MIYFEEYLRAQTLWSQQTFGPGARTKGVLDHLKAEIHEIESSDGDPGEWRDASMIALDGLIRSLMARGLTDADAIETAIGMMAAKLEVNRQRKWPDWRTAAPDKAIEHDRSPFQRRAG